VAVGDGFGPQPLIIAKAIREIDLLDISKNYLQDMDFISSELIS